MFINHSTSRESLYGFLTTLERGYNENHHQNSNPGRSFVHQRGNLRPGGKRLSTAETLRDGRSEQ
jgi:hypothetical protein